MRTKMSEIHYKFLQIRKDEMKRHICVLLYFEPVVLDQAAEVYLAGYPRKLPDRLHQLSSTSHYVDQFGYLTACKLVGSGELTRSRADARNT
jgi:hypothetical protein